MSDKEKDTVLEWIGGIPIRNENYIRIKFNAIQYRRLALVADKTGLSIPAILALMNQPCPVCKNDSLIVTIPHNILYSKKITAGKTVVISLANDKQNEGS